MIGRRAAADRLRDAADEIRLGVDHVRIAPVAIDGACFVASRNGDQLETDLSDLVQNTSAALAVRVGLRLAIGAGRELHQDLAGHRAVGVGSLRRRVRVQRERKETCRDKRFERAAGHALARAMPVPRRGPRVC
jgi:hypothetical protein